MGLIRLGCCEGFVYAYGNGFVSMGSAVLEEEAFRTGQGSQ